MSAAGGEDAVLSSQSLWEVLQDKLFAIVAADETQSRTAPPLSIKLVVLLVMLATREGGPDGKLAVAVSMCIDTFARLVRVIPPPSPSSNSEPNHTPHVSHALRSHSVLRRVAVWHSWTTPKRMGPIAMLLPPPIYCAVGSATILLPGLWIQEFVITGMFPRWPTVASDLLCDTSRES